MNRCMSMVYCNADVYCLVINEGNEWSHNSRFTKILKYKNTPWLCRLNMTWEMSKCCRLSLGNSNVSSKQIGLSQRQQSNKVEKKHSSTKNASGFCRFNKWRIIKIVFFFIWVCFLCSIRASAIVWLANAIISDQNIRLTKSKSDKTIRQSSEKSETNKATKKRISHRRFICAGNSVIEVASFCDEAASKNP